MELLKMAKPSNHSGFTLIEVLVAVSILVIISLGVTQLIVRSKQLADTGREKFVAVNIAREGLELVRAVRDTNWFTDDDRANWVPNTMCGVFTYDAEQFSAGEEVGNELAGAMFLHSDGHWSHTEGVDSIATPYNRVLEIDCSEKDGNPPYVIVTSRVSWEQRGQAQEIVLKDKLYNWLP